MAISDKIQEIRTAGLAKIAEAADEKTLNDIRVKLVGKKGELTQILKSMKDVDPSERKSVGQVVNAVRDIFNEELELKKAELLEAAYQERLKAEEIDVTLPGRQPNVGSEHIINIMAHDLEKLFIGLGYQVISGPEIETDYYNFEMMNLPKDHPARDMQDTFYINPETLLRTQTSPVQARTMEQHDFTKSALKMISPGKVYRRDDDDATHSHQFNQLEGLVIDKNITMADLKGTLELTAKHIFGEDRKTRLRPSFFPFTEPSVEMDVSCFKCDGKGCNVCKQTGWIEVLGAGMVHPNVLTNVGVDPDVYGGFAFGIGIDRFAILKYQISDIRDFYTNDIRFLTQFESEEN